MNEEKIHFDKVIVHFKIYASMKGKIKEQKEEIESEHFTELLEILDKVEEKK